MNIWSDDRIASLDDQIRDVETYSRLLTKGDDVTLGRSHPSWATMIRRESMMEKTLDMEIYICIYTHNVCLQPVRDSQSFLWGQEREFLCWKQLAIGEIIFRSDGAWIKGGFGRTRAAMTSLESVEVGHRKRWTEFTSSCLDIKNTQWRNHPECTGEENPRLNIVYHRIHRNFTAQLAL